MQCTVVGTGAVSAAGADLAAQWQTYRSGRGRWTVDARSGLPVYPAAPLPEVPRLNDFAQGRRLDRASLLALHAARQAVDAAGWHDRDFAILVGCSRGPTGNWEDSFGRYTATGVAPARTSPDTTLGSIGFALADYFGTTSLVSSLSVTCSSGFHALLHGVALLRAGMVERVLVGGTEAALTPFTLAQLRALRVYATPPAGGDALVCRPLSTPPSGMVIGEGAAFLALTLASGTAAGPQLAVGFAREGGTSSTGITPDGQALQQAMRMATEQRGSIPKLVIAHAPGTARGDEAERAAIQAVFGALPTTSLKWATGHTFGASGPLGLVAALQMLEQQQVIGLPYGEMLPPLAQLQSVLVNATGFGGNAVSVHATLG